MMIRAGPTQRRQGRSRSAKFAAALAVAVVLAGCGPKSDSLKLADQKMCAAQSEHMFLSGGGSLTGAVTRIGKIESSGAYASHYNDRVRKCFMELVSHVVDTSNQISTNSAVLSDAFEGTPYATYAESWSGSRMQVDMCNLTLPNSPPLRCASRSEWNALVQPYIEIGAMAR